MLIESEFPDKAFIALSEGIKCHPHLQQIRFNFLDCNITRIGNEGLRSLGEALGGIQSLKTFILCFGSYCEIDEGMEILSKALTKHEELSNLELSMQSTYTWTNKGFQALVRDLKNMNSLSRLSLKFINCREITDQGFRDLGEVLLGLKELEEVSMRFDNCPKVTENIVRQVHKNLKRHTSLEKYEIIYAGPPRFFYVVLTKDKE